MRICLVSRELAPYIGGGIGVYVAALAELLSARGAEVTVVTRAAHRRAHEKRVAAGERLPDVRYVWVPDPRHTEEATFVGHHHAWSGLALGALREAFAGGGPDIVEFPDYHGEAFATLQAKRAGDPVLRDSLILVRAHCSWEMCSRLNGHLGEDAETRAIVALERWSVANADRLLVAGGDIGPTYERVYGGAVAPMETIRHPLVLPPAGEYDDEDYDADWPVRFLYLGRMERRKGADRLLEGLLNNPSDGWSLTYLGGDTDSGVLGRSLGGQLELMSGGDPRVRFEAPVPRDEVPGIVRAHDVVVMPSRWECWPYALLEAMALGRPVMATPTGGFMELVKPGVSGWLTGGTSVRDIARCVDPLIGEPAEVTRLVRSGGPARHARELTEPEAIAGAYHRLAEEARPARPRVARPASVPSLVSVVISYHRMHRFIAEAVASVAAQTYPRLELIIVDDGSLGSRDEIIDRLDAGDVPVHVVTQINGGLGAARNLGISVARGRYVFPLDADNVAEPQFVERAVGVLERDPSVAYVTAWSTFIDEDGRPFGDGHAIGYSPLGNGVALCEELNVAGDAAAVLPRRIFDIGFRYSEDVAICEDWMLYRALRRAGRFGAVIPERLMRYRVRPDSMYQDGGYQLIDRVRAEMTTQLELEEVEWVARS